MNSNQAINNPYKSNPVIKTIINRMLNYTSQIILTSLIEIKENEETDNAAQESLTDKNATYLNFVLVKNILNVIKTTC